ncbi:MAG: DNA primase DnaG [Candidatus Micrarchaeia archaeon]
MAKTYLDIVKYMVEAKFSISGMVDKPDIIGAVFGQTEGLLGDDLDLRELQKSGKIGRIEIDFQQSNNKSFGKLFLPASLDRIETCILAAAVESVDRVGPYESQFSVEKIEDTRSEKRRKILTRAKDLVKLLLNTEIPDSKELSEMVQSDVRTSEITTYGPEKLPAGPEVGKSAELVIVEGRADVINLLRNDVTHVIAVGGASAVPKSIIDLCRQKEVTVFLDGDRGGDMILKNISSVADVDYVARAPDGKEVEDLTRKEIIKSLRTKIPLDQYHPGYRQRQEPAQDYSEKSNMNENNKLDSNGSNNSGSNGNNTNSQNQRFTNNRQEYSRQKDTNSYSSYKSKTEDNKRYESTTKDTQESMKTDDATEHTKPALESVVLTEYLNGLEALSGTLRSRLYDSTGNMMKEIPIRDLLSSVQASNGVHAIVLDGVITQRLVELSIQKGVKAIYGIRANPMPKKHQEILLYTKEHGQE